MECAQCRSLPLVFLSFFKCDMLYFYNVYFAYVRNFLTPLSEIGLVNTPRASAGNPIATSYHKKFGCECANNCAPKLLIIPTKTSFCYLPHLTHGKLSVFMGKRFHAFDNREKFARCASRLGSKKMQLLSLKVSAKPFQKMIFGLGLGSQKSFFEIKLNHPQIP